MNASLQTRLRALEQREQNGGPVVWVRCEHSHEGDPREVHKTRIDRARAGYVAAHGYPLGDIGVIHRVIVQARVSREVAQ